MRTLTMASIKLTDTIVKKLPVPAAGKKITYDAKTKGFGCRVYASGTRTFVLNYRTKTGHERRYTIGSFPDWGTEAARKEAAELKQTIDRGGDPLEEIQTKREAPTVNELCDRFIAEYLPRKKPSTRHTYKLQIESEIRPVLGRRKVNEIAFKDVDELHRKLTKRGVPYRANRVIALLSRLMSMAVKWQWRGDNPVRGIERNRELKRRRYLSADELVRLADALAKLSDQQSAGIIGLLLLTGARRGEALTARWQDFDADFTTWSKPAASTKQRDLHQVPLSGSARQLLLAIRKQVPAGVPWVFPSNGGHRKDVKDSWIAVCKAADLDGVRLHDLRHTFASVLVSTGHSLPLIGAMLGHTQPSTTQRYAHLFDSPLRQAAERAAAAIADPHTAKLAPPKS
jgi:integrase